MLKELIKYHDLLFMLTFRDIRIRYKQAAMGFLWAVFMPIVAVAAGMIIKLAMARISGKDFDLLGVVSIAVKVLPWTFFISSLRFAVQSMVGNSSLVTKIYFPKAVLPLASMLACLFDFSIACLVLVVMLTFAQLGVSIYLLWIPLIVLILALLTAGFGLILATANLFYRDVKYVVEVILTFGIFFTPVLYDASIFGKWEVLLLLNPVGSLLESLNAAVVLKQSPDLFWLSYAAVFSVCLFLVGIKNFTKMEPLFAENI